MSEPNPGIIWYVLVAKTYTENEKVTTIQDKRREAWNFEIALRNSASVTTPPAENSNMTLNQREKSTMST